MPNEPRSTEEAPWISGGEEGLQDTPIVESASEEFALDRSAGPPPDSDSPPPADQDTGSKMYQGSDGEVTKEN